eukprot:TRINITY_DN51604_c0_g1_i1.p1 TRINITY_DN51604_c0_g1~~TRINITY_DN51604_c0_g1_i1.p1  ORF type:complete len:570 (+),score=140.44 TRINITY_DN51604_c0_g1_i1:96-1712(+)
MAQAEGRRGSASAASDASAASNSSRWREAWRAHAEPAQRSHFSIGAPASMILETDAGPVGAGAHPLRHHRKPPRPDAAAPRGPHPLEQFHYGRPHRNQRAQAEAAQRAEEARLAREQLRRRQQEAAAARGGRAVLGDLCPNDRPTTPRQAGKAPRRQAATPPAASASSKSTRPGGTATPARSRRASHGDPMRCSTPAPCLKRMWTAERDLVARRRRSLAALQGEAGSSGEEEGTEAAAPGGGQRLWTEDRARRRHEAWLWQQASHAEVRRRQSYSELEGMDYSRMVSLKSEAAAAAADARMQRRASASTGLDAEEAAAAAPIAAEATPAEGSPEDPALAALPAEHVVRQARRADPSFHLGLSGFDMTYGKKRGNRVPQYHRHNFEQPPAVVYGAHGTLPGRQADGTYRSQWSQLQHWQTQDWRAGREWEAAGDAASVPTQLGDSAGRPGGPGARSPRGGHSVKFGIPKHHKYQFEPSGYDAVAITAVTPQLRRAPRSCLKESSGSWRPAGKGPHLHEQVYDSFRPHAPPPPPARASEW